MIPIKNPNGAPLGAPGRTGEKDFFMQKRDPMLKSVAHDICPIDCQIPDAIREARYLIDSLKE